MSRCWLAGRRTPGYSQAWKFSASHFTYLTLDCQPPQQSEIDFLSPCLCLPLILPPSLFLLSLCESPSVCMSLSLYFPLYMSLTLSLFLSPSLFFSVSLSLYVCQVFSISFCLSLSAFLIHVLFFQSNKYTPTILFFCKHRDKSRFLNVESTDVHNGCNVCNFLPISIFQEKSPSLSTSFPKEFSSYRKKKKFNYNVVVIFNKL